MTIRHAGNHQFDGYLASPGSLPIPNKYIEVTSKTTVSAVLEDISGCTFNLTIPVSGRIMAHLTCQCSATNANTVGAWAVSINAVDGTSIQQNFQNASVQRPMAVQSRSGILSAGSYTVKGRFRRVSGTGTVNTGVAQLSAIFVSE